VPRTSRTTSRGAGVVTSAEARLTRRAPRSPDLASTFATLRDILAANSDQLIVTADKPGDFQVGSPTQQDRIGRPLFVAAVQTRKNYVSYHLMPIYAMPRLAESLSPALKKRLQGKSCFNFTTIGAQQAKELSTLTRAGIEAFRDVNLPWAPSDTTRKPQGRAGRATVTRSGR
jgi:hypothetical protein